jgi:hypothetical protein
VTGLIGAVRNFAGRREQEIPSAEYGLTGGIVHDVMRLRGEAPSGEHNGGDNNVADAGPHLVDAGEVLEDIRAHFPLREAKVRSSSQCIEKAARRRCLLEAHTRSSTLGWCVRLVKSLALIGRNCQGRRVESEATRYCHLKRTLAL